MPGPPSTPIPDLDASPSSGGSSTGSDAPTETGPRALATPTGPIWEGTYGYSVEYSPAGPTTSEYVVTDIHDPYELEAWTLLEDGEQLITKKAYYSVPPEDSYGFLDPLYGFGIIKKNTAYEVNDISSHDARLSSAEAESADLEPFITGEEPILYDDATIIDSKSSQDEQWEAFQSFINNSYINTEFTCYYESEFYLDWYDYSEEHFEFGTTYKDSKAEYMQANYLRAANKPWNSDAGITINYILAEQPWLTLSSQSSPYDLRSGSSDEELDGLSSVIPQGYQHSSALWMSDSLKEDLALRFKTPEMVMATSEAFLNDRIQYVINTGYRTVLKRRLTSKSQKVKRFLKKEFTSLGGVYPTISYVPDETGALSPATTTAESGTGITAELETLTMIGEY